jgi:hypothetical protein
VALVDQVVVVVATEQHPEVLVILLLQLHHKVITEVAQMLRAAVAVVLVLLVVMLLHLLLVRLELEATELPQQFQVHLLLMLAAVEVLVQLKDPVALEAAALVLQILSPEHLGLQILVEAVAAVQIL